MVERFDRTPEGGRIHMEDFAQVFGVFPNGKYDKHSYANIAAVLAAEIGEGAVIDCTRRLAFSVLIGNADMHLKNLVAALSGRAAARTSPGLRLRFHCTLSA